MRQDNIPDGDGESGSGGQPGMQALSRGLWVVDLVASSPRAPRFTTLLDSTGLPKGTLHRILQTLVDERYLRLDPRDQSFTLGARPFELAHRVWDQFDLRGAAEPELVRLRDLTGEAVRLGILDGAEVLYIDQREAQQAVRIANGVGSRAAVHASALGKAIAAHLSPADRHALFKDVALTPFTGSTITSSGDLHQQLNLIKARGYAISVNEQHEGVSAIAAAILDHRAAPLGAIGIVAPSFRLSEDALHMLAREVMEAARRIAGNVGEVAMSISTNPRPFDTGTTSAQCVIPGQDFLGEGPHWDAETGLLHWVDILAPAIISGNPESGTRNVRDMPELVGCVIPRRQGGLVCATETGIKLIDPYGQMHVLCEPESDRPGNRLNDGKCDSRGRLWVGSLAIDTTPGKGALWRIDPDGTASCMADGFHITNGLGWSPDDTCMYVTDSGKRVIWAYDYEAQSGTIGARRVFAELGEGAGVPDGLAVDAEGGVWSAGWDAWNLTRYAPDGRIDRIVPLPVPRPTSVAFGGPGLRTLFITTARIRLSAAALADAPLSGSILSIDPGLAGLPVTSFAG